MINKFDRALGITNGKHESDTGRHIMNRPAWWWNNRSTTSMIPHITYTLVVWSLGITWGRGWKSTCLLWCCGRNMKGGLAGFGEVCRIAYMGSGRCRGQGNAITPSPSLHDGYLGIYPYTSVQLLLLSRFQALFVKKVLDSDTEWFVVGLHGSEHLCAYLAVVNEKYDYDDLPLALSGSWYADVYRPILLALSYLLRCLVPTNLPAT